MSSGIYGSNCGEHLPRTTSWIYGRRVRRLLASRKLLTISAAALVQWVLRVSTPGQRSLGHGPLDEILAWGLTRGPMNPALPGYLTAGELVQLPTGAGAAGIHVRRRLKARDCALATQCAWPHLYSDAEVDEQQAGHRHDEEYEGAGNERPLVWHHAYRFQEDTRV